MKRRGKERKRGRGGGKGRRRDVIGRMSNREIKQEGWREEERK